MLEAFGELISIVVGAILRLIIAACVAAYVFLRALIVAIKNPPPDAP